MEERLNKNFKINSKNELVNSNNSISTDISQEHLNQTKIDLQMFHFENDQNMTTIDNSKINVQSLNICTLNYFKLQIIADFLKNKSNQIQVLTEINLSKEKFDKISKYLPSNCKQQCKYKKFNHINGGVAILYSNNLKIKIPHHLNLFEDFRLIFVEFSPNINYKILIAAVQLPTVDMFEWQGLDELNPSVSLEQIRVGSGGRKEQQYYTLLLHNLVSFHGQEHVLILGDFNSHFLSTVEVEQPKYILQRNAQLTSLQQLQLTMKEFHPDNNLKQTQFKHDKTSQTDYVFATDFLRSNINQVKISNDALISTDHNIISFQITIPHHEVINASNIDKKFRIKSNLLKDEQFSEEYKLKLLEKDISNSSIPELIRQMKEPLIRRQRARNSDKVQINDDQTKELKRQKRLHMNNKEFVAASEVTRTIKRQVKRKRQESKKAWVDEILRNRHVNMRNWFQLSSGIIKPKKSKLQLMRNAEGLEDIDFTIQQFTNFFRDLQQRQMFDVQLEVKEEWQAQFIVRFYPHGAFEMQYNLIKGLIEDGTSIGQDELNAILLDLNHSYGCNYNSSDIESFIDSSKNKVKNQYYEEFIGTVVSEEEITILIKEFQSNKAPGADQIDNRILKNLPKEQINRIASIQQDILSFNQIDDEIKNVIITLLNKTDGENPGVEDFRPISLLSTIGFKLLEKVLAKRILLGDNFLQFGFKPTNSTTDMMQMFKESLKSCKNLQNETGTFVSTQVDFKKAFNSINFQKLVPKLQRAGVDPLLISSILNLFMAQKVQFRMGDTLSHQPIKLNVYAGHQGSCSMPKLFKFYIFPILDTLEQQQSNLIRLNMNERVVYCNHVSFADDLNKLDYFKNKTRYNVISNRIQEGINTLKDSSQEIDLQISIPKSKLLTNRPNELGRAVEPWNNFEIVNQVRLVGFRFKLNRDLDLDFKNQFEQVIQKFTESLSKIKIAQKVNKFLSIRDVINLIKSFSLPIVDYGNIVIEQKEKYIKKLDQILQRELKHILGFRQTALTLNFVICFQLAKWGDRSRVAKLIFQLKSFMLPYRSQMNACSNHLQTFSHQTKLEILETILEGITPMGLAESLANQKVIDLFDYEDMDTFQQFKALYVNSKRNVPSDTITGFIRVWFKKSIAYKQISDNIFQDGEFILNNMQINLWRKRMDQIAVEQQEGREFIKNPTFWFAFKQYDPESRLNSFEVNTERKLNQRFMKVFLAGYRFNYRVRRMTQNAQDDHYVTNGCCCYCRQERGQTNYEDEEHFLKDCLFQEDLRDLAYNLVLPTSRFQITREGFRSNMTMQCFASQEMLERLFSFEKCDQQKFNLYIKEMVKQMLDRRKEQMINLSVDLNNRPDIIDHESQSNQKNYQEWLY